jgi:hypothetical protein
VLVFARVVRVLSGNPSRKTPTRAESGEGAPLRFRAGRETTATLRSSPTEHVSTTDCRRPTAPRLPRSRVRRFVRLPSSVCTCVCTEAWRKGVEGETAWCGTFTTPKTKGSKPVEFRAFLLGGPIGIRTRVMVTITSSRVMTESCAMRPIRKMGATRTRWQSYHTKYWCSAFESVVAPQEGRFWALVGEGVSCR